jgi:hypothetical protein
MLVGIDRLSDNYCRTTGVWDLASATVKPMSQLPDDRPVEHHRPDRRRAARDALRRGPVPGEPLREVSLAEGFGVARSTVREALQVLAGRGW